MLWKDLASAAPSKEGRGLGGEAVFVEPLMDDISFVWSIHIRVLQGCCGEVKVRKENNIDTLQTRKRTD
jgi:hypothetical protein